VLKHTTHVKHVEHIKDIEHIANARVDVRVCGCWNARVNVGKLQTDVYRGIKKVLLTAQPFITH